jgi:methionyl-tRNA formyltransferase
MRLIFMGTPDFAVPTLVELAARGHEIAAVYTRAPKPAGRGMDVQRAPVEQEARRLALTVHTPKTLKDEEAQAAFRADDADAAVVVAYGLILPKSVLEAPRLGCFNIHASLLPRWRGAAPINRAIMAGDAESGVTIMKMNEGLDTGAMGMAERVPIGVDMTAGDLHDALSRLGADLMLRTLAAAERGSLTLTPQLDNGVSYAEKISKNEARIDWSKPWKQVHDHIRRAFTISRRVVRDRWRADQGVALDQRRRLRCGGTVLDDKLTIACGAGAVRLTQAARRQAADVGGRVPARHAGEIRRAGDVTCRATN